MQLESILDNLLRIPSLSGDAKACKKIVHKSRSILSQQGIKSKVILINKKPILIWGELNISKTNWLINSHLDIVPGRPNQFIPRIERGKVWGRGAADTKSGCALLLEKAKEWNDFAKTKNITFMLVTDEEIGGETTKQVIPKMKCLKGGIFLEPTGEKMIVQAKGIIQLKITASGVACHGSRPWEGENALEKITLSLARFRDTHTSPKSETRNTTFNFSFINSGTAINQIPSSAELWCDIRWSPADNPKNIVDDIKNIFSNCLVETVKLESTVDCPKNSLLKSSFANSLKSNSINPISGFEHGSSDARHCTALGVPAIVFGPKGKNLHTINEWVSLKSLGKVEKVLDHWIKNI